MRLVYTVVCHTGLSLSPKVPSKKRSLSSKWVGLVLSQPVSFGMVRTQG